MFKYEPITKSLMKKRGQVALEFLMTYGWAIFAMLAVIAALAFFGVFNVDQFIVERCQFSTGIICVDSVIAPSGVTVAIQNAMSVDVEQVSLLIPGCSNTPIEIASIDSGSQHIFSDDCSLNSADPFKSTLVFNYTNPQSTLEHTKRGELAGRVQ